MPRRRLAHALLALPLAGCGFHPVYAPPAQGGDSPVALELSAIEVPVMPERVGMLMRQALQDRLQRFGMAAAKRYQLSAPLSITAEGVGIDVNTNITRIRYVGVTNWTLRDQSNGHIVVGGQARVINGTNVFDSQFFATTQETGTIDQQIAEALADQVVTRISAYFAAAHR